MFGSARKELESQNVLTDHKIFMQSFGDFLLMYDEQNITEFKDSRSNVQTDLEGFLIRRSQGVRNKPAESACVQDWTIWPARSVDR